MKYLRIILTLLILTSLLWPGNCLSTFQVVNAAINTAGICGVNNPHIWWDSQAYTALDTIKKFGFNAVRIVWQTNGTAARLKQIIDRCKTLGLKPIPELHDVTGSSKVTDLEQMVNYWIGCKSVLTSDIWINIANKWNPDSGTAWCNAYKSAITAMRNAGITNPLVIDAPDWGQDTGCIKTYGRELLAHDPQQNIIFSIHMYSGWNSQHKIRSELTALKKLGLPLLIGEFGYNANNGNNSLNCKVDAADLIATCNELGIGYLAWSWCGNNPDLAWLDLTNNWDELTDWGQLVVQAMQKSKAPNSSAPPGKVVLADFESNTENWSGFGISGGPWVTNEWQVSGRYSLKADISLGADKQFYLAKTGAFDFSGKTQLKTVVRHAPWGKLGTGIQAKLYVKTGNSWTRYDSGTVPVNSNPGTTLTLDLTNLANLNDIKEYGVQFTSGAGSGGTSAIYLDYVTLQ
ncbi:MAG TPA: cellulase family glycosylhydrolase [Bacillota bacterium]